MQHDSQQEQVGWKRDQAGWEHHLCLHSSPNLPPPSNLWGFDKGLAMHLNLWIPFPPAVLSFFMNRSQVESLTQLANWIPLRL